MLVLDTRSFSVESDATDILAVAFNTPMRLQI